MAITVEMRTQVAQLYVALFGRAPDAEGLGYWVSQLGSGAQDLNGVANAMFATAPARAYYPSFLTNEEIIASFYQNVLGREADAEGLAYWTAKLNGGQSEGEVINELINNVATYDGEDPAGLESAALFNNRVEVAQHYGETGGDIAGATSALAGVTSDPASVQAAIDAIDAGGSAGAVTGQLTTGQDFLVGGAGNDVFTGVIFDNQNTFQSGDTIIGGAGVDELHIRVGNSQAFAINAFTESVEKVFVQAQAGSHDSSDNDINNHGIDKQVQIDAQDMQGVREFWSVNSRANLTIEDVRVNSHETTIGVRNTDPGQVHYEVYFDNQHITAEDPFASGSALRLRLLDLEGMRTDGLPLLNNPYNGFSFRLDDVRYVIQADSLIEATSFAELVDAINAELAANPALAGLTAALGDTYTALHADTGVGYVGTEIVITNAEAGTLTPGGWLTPTGEAPADTNVVASQSNQAPDTTDPLTSVNVILDNVGRDSKAGDVVIGGISGSGHSGSAGIQQFDVQVDRNSWIDELRSTNNSLEVVNVVNIAENNAAGDGSVRIDELIDVRVFDASAMEGDVSLHADLTAKITPKYLDLTDSQDNPRADNPGFNYSTGNGDDSIELHIESSNLAYAGLSEREDFDLNISTGAGDDYVQFYIGEDGDLDDLAYAGGFDFGSGNGFAFQNWYDNQKLNANLQINTGDGNDTIWTPGSGDVVINAGSGDDAIYVDDGAFGFGNTATFVFNTFSKSPIHTQLGNLQSDANDSYRIYGGELTVTFRGYEVTVDLPSNNGRVTDLHVNQAIKNAINNDPIVSKLAVALDGPANTLIVESLIDGEFTTSDLTVSLAAPATLTGTEVSMLNSIYGTSGYTAAQLISLMNGEITAFNNAGDYATTFATDGFAAITGEDSLHTSDNTITGGTGNDVIVLGTGAFSNDTVVYEGFGNGYDAIVNFDTNWVDSDTITIVDEVEGSPESFIVTFADLPVLDVEDATTLQITIDADGDPETDAVVNAGPAILLGADGTFPDSPEASLIPGIDVAFTVADAFFNAGGVGNPIEGWVAEWIEGTNQVKFTSVANGNVVPNFSAENFVFTNTAAEDVNGGVTVSNIVEGVDDGVEAETATFELDLYWVTVAADGDFEFDGTTVAYTAGDGPITLAAKIAAKNYANWTVVDSGDGVVTFTAKVAGDREVLDDTVAGSPANVFDTGSLGDGLDAILFSGSNGSDQEGVVNTITFEVPAGAGADYLDFSSYDVAAVYVNSGLVAGGLTASNKTYVHLVESTTNAGEYSIAVMDGGTDGFGGTVVDLQVGAVGVADFGASQDFVAQNFII